MLHSSGLLFLSLEGTRLSRIKMDGIYRAKDKAQEESRRYTCEKGDTPKRL